jgi:pimeloyl-ACP methyl ester carboxylesterase
MPGENIDKINGVEICSQTFGDPGNPAIILIMGAAASMIWWDEEFCQRLASQGRFVIRFDNRDVGRSESYETGKPGYGVEDMADDAIGVLDHYKIGKAHFVGMSLGGMISQIAALKFPDRVLSLTLISSGIWDIVPTLPQIDKKILDYHAGGQFVDWSDRDTVIKYMAEGWRLLNGSRHPFDASQSYRLAEKEYDRARNLTSMFNHALLKGAESYFGQSRNIKAPTLIIHGTEDPVLPIEHGEYLAKTIPGSRLVKLEGRGHEIHKNDWDRVIDEIVKVTGL